MVVIDTRKKREFCDDIQKIKKLNMKSYTNYNRQYCKSSVVLSIIFIVASNILRWSLYDLCVSSPNMISLSTLYFAALTLSMLSPVALAFIIIETNYKPYLIRRMKFDSVRRAIIKAGSYDEVAIILDRLDKDDLSICTDRSREWLKSFKVYCMIDCFVSRYDGCEILSANRNIENTRLRLRGIDRDDVAFQTDLPFAGKIKGGTPAVLLTSDGVVLSEAA